MLQKLRIFSCLNMIPGHEVVFRMEPYWPDVFTVACLTPPTVQDAKFNGSVYCCFHIGCSACLHVMDRRI